MNNTDNKKGRKAIIIMAVVSVIIIFLGMLCAFVVYSELSNRITASSGELIIDGSDFGGIVSMMGQAGTFVLSACIVLISFFAVGLQWIGYLIVTLIMNSLKKKNEQPNYTYPPNLYQ